MLVNNTKLLFYVLVVAPVSIALFLYGFFPIAHYGNAIATQQDVPKHVGSVSVKADLLYKPVATKLIIVVIDALRWDFVAGPVGKAAMPVTRSLLANSSGCLVRARLQSPTVTMPRIKAMMTGTVPNFVDVILNFGSKPLSSDNLLLQARKQEHRVIFYGDNTWLSLFPHTFERHEGTTSFFVTDFTEVDTNVTRHVEGELNHDDWSVMILHYLGLDHIGHVEGPFGTSIKPKLQEMDEIIDQIARRVQYWNNNGVPALFIVCGDHGMKDSGGHGGSTPQETTVPLVVMGGTRCSRQESGEPIEIEQLDIAATLSVALGLPIPLTNLGSVFLDSIYDLPDAKRLFLLYYNSKQLFDYFRSLFPHRESQSASHIQRKYVDTVKLHVAWLNGNGNSSEMIESIVSSYNAILMEMKNTFISSMVKYDFHSMIAAVFLLCQILIIVFFVQNVACTYRKSLYLFLKYFLLHLVVCYVYCRQNTTSFCPTDAPSVLLFLLIITISSANIYFCTSNHLSLTELTKGPKMRGIFQIGMFLHVISFAGSSFVEEEHQTWYFLWASTITYLLYHCSGRLFMYHRYCSDSRHSRHVQLCAKLFLLLLGHRALRQLNSTGDKYAHLPDIAGWLKEDHSKMGTTVMLSTALVLLIWTAYECEVKKYRRQSLICNVVIAACIYLRHMANGAVMKIPLRFSSSGILEVQVFWGITALYLLSYSYRVISILKRNKSRFASTMTFMIITTWVMISAILHQPYNVILLPMQIVASSTIDDALRENDLLDASVFVHCWLGNVFYFYQGNSNSLASIDIAAGYVGLRSYVPFVTGVYLIISTYSAPVLAYFLLVYHFQSNTTDCVEARRAASRTYIAWRLLTMTVYAFIVILQRHHLFVWSVFSPKLLYEAMYTATACCSVLLALIVITLQAALNNS